MGFNYKYINNNDSQNDIIDKININFDQILFHGIGYMGDIGPRGATGVTGPIGIKGKTGPDGIPSSNWFRQNEPPTENVNKYDYWINTSPGILGSDKIYYYNGNNWEDTNETLSKSSIFKKVQEVIGIGGVKEKNAIISSNEVNPWKETFIFSDFELDETNINPNYSKLRIVTNGDSSYSNEIPLLTLSKLNYIEDLQPPSIYWKNNNPADFGISYRGSGDLRLESGGDLKILAGSKSPISSIYSGSIRMDINSIVSIDSPSDINFISSGLIDSNISAIIEVEKDLEIKSNNLITDTITSKFPRGLEIGSFDSINTEIIGQKKQFPRVSLNFNLQDNISALETVSYSSDNLYSPSGVKVPLEDYRNQDQSEGQGAFRTELVRIGQGSTKIDLGYVKNGYPGVTGSYSIKKITELKLQISEKAIKNVTYPYVNVESTSNYKNSGISIITNTIGLGGPVHNAFWLKIKTGNITDLPGVWNEDSVVPYRFYYRGSSWEDYGVKGISTPFRIAGIIYKDSPIGKDKVITFKTPVKTFELIYFGKEKKIFYKTTDTSGVITIKDSEMTTTIPGDIVGL